MTTDIPTTAVIITPVLLLLLLPTAPDVGMLVLCSAVVVILVVVTASVLRTIHERKQHEYIIFSYETLFVIKRDTNVCTYFLKLQCNA